MGLKGVVQDVVIDLDHSGAVLFLVGLGAGCQKDVVDYMSTCLASLLMLTTDTGGWM